MRDFEEAEEADLLPQNGDFSRKYNSNQEQKNTNNIIIYKKDSEQVEQSFSLKLEKYKEASPESALQNSPGFYQMRSPKEFKPEVDIQESLALKSKQMKLDNKLRRQRLELRKL